MDLTLRPRAWEDYIGQNKTKQNVRIIIDAAKQRKEPPEHLLFYGGPGLGKCINKESIVFTEQGMVPIQELGDINKRGFQEKQIKVFSNPGPVISSHFYNNGICPTIKITTHQAYEIEGTPNHRVVILNDNGETVFRQLKNLKAGDFICIQREQNFFGNIIDLPKFCFFPTSRSRYNYDKFTLPQQLSTELSRTLGYLIGDGYVGDKSSKGAVSFNNNDYELLKDFQDIWLKIFNQRTKIQKWHNKCPAIRAGNIKIRKFLIAIGLPYSTAHTKEVPRCIMKAPRYMVKEFLSAYFECDGHIRPNCRQMEINSASRALLRQVQIILLNFGIVSRVYQSNKGGSAKYPNPSWRLTITGEDVDIFLKEIGFITKRKNQVVKNFSPIRNTNKDLVPFGKTRIKEIRKILIDLNEKLQKKEYRENAKKQISNQEAKKCVERILSAWQNINLKIDELKKISARNIFWDKVKTIENTAAHTVDLSIPHNHAFFANGFINHNTTLAHLIAGEIDTDCRITSGPAVERAGDLAAILTNLQEGSVLFIDEIHRLPRIVEEYLYPALEDFKLNLVLGKGPMARTMELKVPRFTLIGATTRLAAVSSPLRSRFGAIFGLNFYNLEDIKKILSRSAKLLNIAITDQALATLAKSSRFTPRTANHLLKRTRDFAQVRGGNEITDELAKFALESLEIDEHGLNANDRRLLEVLVQKFNGGPAGLQTLAAATAEEEETILEVYEPHLMRLGFIARTPRGRVATKLAFEYLGKKTPKSLLL